jgi:hypothetical protein
MMKIRGLSPKTAAQLLAKRCAAAPPKGVHVFICVADHFEPNWLRPSAHVQQARVERWVKEYPQSVRGLSDSIGRPPQQTFFYPAEDDDPALIEQLAGLARAGLGDVEVHLHHDNDSAENLRATLTRFAWNLHDRHGLLAREPDGSISYGFVHGNWAINNSRPDGRWCGVQNELTILRQTGCYADFTMPSAPAECQTSTINSIYYAKANSPDPMAHAVGTRATTAAPRPVDCLLMIQGPLMFDWGNRKWGVLPRLENGDLTSRRPPSWERFLLWCSAAVTVAGRPDWIFIKLHTHGAQEANSQMLLGEPMRRFHESLAEHARAEPGFRYYYVTAREMATLAQQAVRGTAVSPPQLIAGMANG